jgi:hypothetical protein
VNPILEIAYNTEDFSSSQREGCWFPEEVRRVTYSSPTTNNTRGLKDTTLGPPVIRLNWGVFKIIHMKKKEIYVYVDSSNIITEARRLLEKYNQPIGDIRVSGFDTSAYGYHYLVFTEDDKNKEWFVDDNNNKKVQITLSQLEEILKGETLKQNNMKTNTISRTDLGEIYDIACNTWKTKLEKLALRNPFSDTIELTQSELDEMFKAATLDQRPVLVNIFGEQSNSVDLTDLDDIKYEINDNTLLAVRVAGEYRDKGFYLNGKYNWEIVKDNLDQLVLIPTRKSPR